LPGAHWRPIITNPFHAFMSKKQQYLRNDQQKNFTPNVVESVRKNCSFWRLLAVVASAADPPSRLLQSPALLRSDEHESKDILTPETKVTRDLIDTLWPRSFSIRAAPRIRPFSYTAVIPTHD
jgi:hypothetical protein